MFEIRQQLRRALSNTDAPTSNLREERKCRSEDRKSVQRVGSDKWVIDEAVSSRYSRASNVLATLRKVGGEPEERRQAVTVVCEYVAHKRAKGMRTADVAVKVDALERACETGLLDVFDKARVKCRLPFPSSPYETLSSSTDTSSPLGRSWSGDVTAASIFRDAYLKQREMTSSQPRSKVIGWLA